MTAYLAILKSRLSILFQYRLSAIAGLCTQVFWGAVKVMIFKAFYLNAKTLEPITLSQTITFIWISQALFVLIPWNVDKELEAQIKKGDIAYELTRPIDLYCLWFFRSIAMRIVPTLLRAVPLFIVVFFLWGWPPPISFDAGILFFISLLLSFLLSSAITAFLITTFFWTISGEGIQRLMPHFVTLLSGSIIPLPFFPKWLQPIINWQPFRGIIDIPSRIYTGIISLNEVIYYLSFQMGWFIIFLFLGFFLMKKALKTFVIQGG